MADENTPSGSDILPGMNEPDAGRRSMMDPAQKETARKILNLGVWQDANIRTGELVTRIPTGGMTPEQVQSTLDTLKGAGFSPYEHTSQEMGQTIRVVGKEAESLISLRREFLRDQLWDASQALTGGTVGLNTFMPGDKDAVFSALASDQIKPAMKDGGIAITVKELDRFAGPDVADPEIFRARPSATESSKFMPEQKQMDLFSNAVGATEAAAPPPAMNNAADMSASKMEAPKWGDSDVQNYIKQGGFRLVALKGNAEVSQYDFTELDKAQETWNVRLVSLKDPEKSYGLDDLKKLQGDDSLTWAKLLQDRGTEPALKINDPAMMPAAPVAPVVKTEGMENAAPASTGTATMPAPDADGKDKKGKPDIVPDAVDPNMETEEARQKKIKDQEAEIARRAQMNMPKDDMAKPKGDMQQQPEMSPEEEMALAKYRSAFHKKGYIELMNGEWGVPDVDDELKKALGESGEIRKNKKYGLDFLLPNGHKIEWHANMGGAEFIGMTRRTDSFDMDDAHAVVATSKSRGWKNLNVHGSVEQKDMMWLEAKRQGLEVANHQPSVNSKYRAMWNAESQETLDKNVIGASPTEHGNPSIPKNGMQQDSDDMDMSPPAQQKKTPADSPFMKGKGMPTEMNMQQNAAAPAQPMDTVDAFRAFLDREAEAAKGDPAKLAKIQDLKDKLDGKKPAMDNVDPDIAKTAEKEGVKIPAIVDGSAKPGKVGEGDMPKKDTPAAAMTFEQQLDREIKNEKNSPEVREGLKELKQAIVDKKVDADGMKNVNIGMTDGMVSRKDFEAVAKAVETPTFKASPLKDPPAGNKSKAPVMANT